MHSLWRFPLVSGHDDDIQCLAMHPNRTLVATGQVASTRSCPMLCVWDTTLTKDRCARNAESDLALSFSSPLRSWRILTAGVRAPIGSPLWAS